MLGVAGNFPSTPGAAWIQKPGPVPGVASIMFMVPRMLSCVALL